MLNGPIELVVIKFPGNQFKGEIAPEVKKLVDAKVVRLIDILFIKKDMAGDFTVMEINDVDDLMNEAFVPLLDSLAGYLSEEDAKAWAAAMEPNSSVVLMLFENTWASPFTEAVRGAKGEVIFNERIPRSVIQEAATEMGIA